MKIYEIDIYRITGNKNYFKQITTDFRCKYMYYWRKAVSNQTSFLFKKWCFLRMRAFVKIYHIEIPYSVDLGAGFDMDHAYNITINEHAKVGNNVTMCKGSTIGLGKNGSPKIGNNVYIGINSTVVGNITIGDDVLIAANSFVNFDVPSHSIVIGNPGIIHHKENATHLFINNTDYNAT